MLRHCQLLNGTSSFHSDEILISTLDKFYYRMQRIVSLQGDTIGVEVLLDFQRAQGEIGNGIIEYTRAINDGRSLDFLLNALLKKTLAYSQKKIFINVERMNLCNKVLLRKIATTSRKLYVENDTELVVEITERNPCGYCADILHGLVFLKKNKVYLAVDDFDLYHGDFRNKEVDIGLYDYIKVNIPESIEQARKLNEFVSSRKEKIIIEMVDEHNKIRKLGISNNVFGYQGFAYN